MENLPRIALALPEISPDDIAYVTRAMTENWITTGGPFVNEFENDLKAYLDISNDIIAINSGTSALHLALTVAGVKEGDFVLCQTMSYVATANPIQYLKAKPIFIDSETDTYNICPEALKEAILDCIKIGQMPKALILVHSYGIPCKINELTTIARNYEIPIIEDAAEALGSYYEDQKCGSFGDFSVFSFNGNKILTAGSGGALICRSDSDAQRARHLASLAKSLAFGFEHDAVGYNYLMPGLNAALGTSQLRNLESKLVSKNKINAFYKELFKEIDGVTFIETSNTRSKSNHWLNGICFDNLSFDHKTPQGLLEYLISKNIESRFLWKPLHLQGIYTNQSYYGATVAEDLWKSGLCLPSGTGMSDEDLIRIESTLKDYFKV